MYSSDVKPPNELCGRYELYLIELLEDELAAVVHLATLRRAPVALAQKLAMPVTSRPLIEPFNMDGQAFATKIIDYS